MSAMGVNMPLKEASKHRDRLTKSMGPVVHCGRLAKKGADV